MKWRFEVPGDPVGYTTTTFKSKGVDKRFTKYADYCKKVRKFARANGVPLPLIATKDEPLVIKTIAYFKNGTHCDPGNVQKGIVDALFYIEDAIKKVKRGGRKRVVVGGKKGDDKHTGGAFPPPRYDPKNPRVIVIIKTYDPIKG